MNLYDLRIHHGMTREELGAKAKVSPDTIYNIEVKGTTPATKTAVALTKFFSKKEGRVVPASELFPRENNVVPLPPRDAA